MADLRSFVEKAEELDMQVIAITGESGKVDGAPLLDPTPIHPPTKKPIEAIPPNTTKKPLL